MFDAIVRNSYNYKIVIIEKYDVVAIEIKL